METIRIRFSCAHSSGECTNTVTWAPDRMEQVYVAHTKQRIYQVNSVHAARKHQNDSWGLFGICFSSQILSLKSIDKHSDQIIQDGLQLHSLQMMWSCLIPSIKFICWSWKGLQLHVKKEDKSPPSLIRDPWLNNSWFAGPEKENKPKTNLSSEMLNQWKSLILHFVLYFIFMAQSEVK